MTGATNGDRILYRCRLRDVTSPPTDHPPTLSVAESRVLAALHDELFLLAHDPAHRDRVIDDVTTIAAADTPTTPPADHGRTLIRDAAHQIHARGASLEMNRTLVDELDLIVVFHRGANEDRIEIVLGRLAPDEAVSWRIGVPGGKNA